MKIEPLEQEYCLHRTPIYFGGLLGCEACGAGVVGAAGAN